MSAPLSFTAKGKIELWRGTRLISSHVSEAEAIETLIADTAKNGPGIYELRFPTKVVTSRMRVLGALAPQTGDVTAPSIPQNVVATAVNAGRVDLSWTASTDDFGVAGYQIFRNGSPLNTTTATSYTDSTCQPSTLYSYVIVAFDSAGNSSASSNAAVATTPANAAPVWQSVPAQTLIVGNSYLLTLTSFCSDADLDTLTFTVTAGTLPTGVTLSGTRLQGTPTTAGETPTVTVQAADAFHQIATTIAFSTKTADVTAPPVPTGLAATPASSSQIDVAWTASVDVAGTTNEFVSGIKDYRVYRDGSLRTTVTSPTTSYSDTGLSASTQYSYRVTARDQQNNESAQSSAVNATTSTTAAGVLTLTGTGFGTRSTLAPIKTAFMETTTTGQNYAAAGLDFISLNWVNQTAKARVDMTAGWGGGSFRCLGEGAIWGEPFWHFGHSIPAGVTEFFATYYCRYLKSPGSGGPSGNAGQIKGLRCGSSTAYSDPNTLYNDRHDLAFHALWANLANPTSAANHAQIVSIYHDDSQNEITPSFTTVDVNLYDQQWHLIEFYGKWNTPGQSNGVIKVWCDCTLIQSFTNLNITSQTREFRYIQYNPGLANGFSDPAAVTDAWHSRMLVDRSMQAIYIKNAAATRKLYFVPTFWSGTTVLGDASHTSIPAEFLPANGAQAYVRDANGNEILPTSWSLS
jgi:chitodextrinase